MGAERKSTRPDLSKSMILKGHAEGDDHIILTIIRNTLYETLKPQQAATILQRSPEFFFPDNQLLKTMEMGRVMIQEGVDAGSAGQVAELIRSRCLSRISQVVERPKTRSGEMRAVPPRIQSLRPLKPIVPGEDKK